MILPKWRIFGLIDSEEKDASLFQQTLLKNLNIKRSELNMYCSKLSIKVAFYDSDKKFLASGIIAFFRLLYFHNECYNNHSFLLGLIPYMKL